MKYDLSTVPTDIAYKILASTVVPRPIAWVTTRSREGVVNAAPYSFFNAVGSAPPTIVLGLLDRPGGGGRKDTAANIVETGEFVVNLVPERLSQSMNATCIDAPPGINELELAGLEPIPSDMIAPPRIAGSPVAFECRTLHHLATGPMQTLIVGQVLCAHIDDAYILDVERAYIDTPALELIGRMHGGGWYARATPDFHLDRPIFKRPTPGG